MHKDKNVSKGFGFDETKDEILWIEEKVFGKKYFEVKVTSYDHGEAKVQINKKYGPDMYMKLGRMSEPETEMVIRMLARAFQFMRKRRKDLAKANLPSTTEKEGSKW